MSECIHEGSKVKQSAMQNSNNKKRAEEQVKSTSNAETHRLHATLGSVALRFQSETTWRLA